MEDYLKQFVHKFKEEALDLLTQLENELLELEATKATKEHLETIFRVMHTLKGTAGMYGFDNIQSLTHHLETVYDLIREGTVRIDSHILEVTLISVDHIKNLLSDEDLLNAENQNKQAELLALLVDLVSQPTINALIEVANNPTNEKQNKTKTKKSTYYILFKASQQLLDRGISLLNIFRDLAELGTYFIVDSFEETGRNDEKNLWGIYFVTDSGITDISEVFLFVEDNVEIKKITELNLFENSDFMVHVNEMENTHNPNDKQKIQQSILELVEETYKHVYNKPETTNNEVKPSDSEIDKYITKAIETPRISVNADKLDLLMHLVTELVTTQSQFSLAIQNEDMRSLREIYDRSQKLAKQFRDNTLDIRLIPLGDVLVRFKRLIRDLSKQLGKEIELTTIGMETELDKSMIDSLTEPLLHLIRNCIDHGIETPAERIAKGKTAKGHIELTAYNSGSHVYIEISDDGAGIDIQKIKEKAIKKGLWPKNADMSDKEAHDMLFRAGFTTTTNVTEVSGRGVGMNIVKRKLSEVRGEINIESVKDKYTIFGLKLQPTIAIIDTMLVKVEDTFCLIPISDIEICDQIERSDLISRQHLKTISYRNNPTAFIDMREKLKLTSNLCPDKSKLVFISFHGKTFAVAVDKIIGEHQAVLKPLGDEFKQQQIITSASTLGDGSLAFMLDMNALWADVEKDKSITTQI